MASFPTAGATLMPLAIATFRASYPDVELTLAEGEPEEIAPRLRAGELDLALLFEFERGERRCAEGTTRVELLEDPMFLALPARASRSRAGRALRLEDLRERGLGADLALEPLRAPRRALLPRGGLRAAACPSRATTTRRSRASSRPAWAWR